MSRHITREELARQFHLPISEAAKNVGVCATVLKKVCRSYGILRWPQRKVTALNKRIAAYQTELRYSRSMDRRALLTDFIEETRRSLANIMADPSATQQDKKENSDSSSGTYTLKRGRDRMSISAPSRTTSVDEEVVNESPRNKSSAGAMDLLLNAISYVEEEQPERPAKRTKRAPPSDRPAISPLVSVAPTGNPLALNLNFATPVSKGLPTASATLPAPTQTASSSTAAPFTPTPIHTTNDVSRFFVPQPNARHPAMTARAPAPFPYPYSGGAVFLPGPTTGDASQLHPAPTVPTGYYYGGW